eukprot:gene14321-15810_t
MANSTRVFVYGTLKRGFPNHKLLSNVAENERAIFLSQGCSKEKYPLVVGSQAHIPFMLDSPGIGENIKGEVYQVCGQVLQKLDELECEGVLYDRSLISVVLPDDNLNNRCIEAHAYIIKNFKENLLELPMIANYTEEHAERYKKRVQRDFSLENLVELLKNV